MFVQASERHQVTLSWDDSLPGVLADGYDSHYGARSLKYEVSMAFSHCCVVCDVAPSRLCCL